MVKHQETVADLSMVELSQALRTLKEVVDILSAIQAVHFLITAAELHLRLHEWGKKSDANNHNHHAHDGELTHHPNQLR
ncbi:hypothetical protein ACSBR1_009418 [Camellia fascicularis]